MENIDAIKLNSSSPSGTPNENEEYPDDEIELFDCSKQHPTATT